MRFGGFWAAGAIKTEETNCVDSKAKTCVHFENEKRKCVLFRQHVEREAIRVSLKHLRQRRLLGAAAALQAATGVQLEDPALTALHDVVVSGAWACRVARGVARGTWRDAWHVA